MQNPSIFKIKKSLLNFNLRENNRPVIFLICLVIASGLWFVNSLGKEYETVVSMPVQYTNLPKNKVLINPPPSALEVTMKANGYTLLRHKFKLTFTPIYFNLRSFGNNLLEKTNNNDFEISTDKYSHEIAQQVTSDITILDISPDTLFFHFDSLIVREKPIVPNFKLEFENQYFLENAVAFSPKMVTVKGPKTIVDTLKYVITTPQRFKHLNTSIKQTVFLQKIDLLEIEPNKVEATIPVSQYTEFTEKISVTKFNVPSSVNLVTFPGVVEISCLVSISNYKKITKTGFIIGVDFNKITTGDKRLPLTIYNAPPYINQLKFHPAEVEFIIEKK